MSRFFSNPGYATWVQSALILVSVAIAILAIRSSDRQASVTNAVTIARRYYEGSPPLAESANELRRTQYRIVGEAIKHIQGYSRESDNDFSKLFEVARPMVKEAISNDPSLQKKYASVESYFILVVMCVNADACSENTIVLSLGEDLRAFYNAVCPYLEERERLEKNDRDSKLLLKFLVEKAKFRNPAKDYFCRDKVTQFLVSLASETSNPPYFAFQL
jgi:hypothetical protein